VVDYRVDELARAAGTTVGNVRVYQDRGLLPPPRRQGRIALYGDAHLSRLRLIASLLERGYTFAHIAAFLDAWQTGRGVAELIGLEEELTHPWSDEAPAEVTQTELAEMFGDQLDTAATDRAVRLGLLQRAGDGYRAPSPRLLRAGAELVAAGIPLAAVLDLDEALAADVERIAGRLVRVIADHVLAGREPGWVPHGPEAADLAALIRRMRPLAQTAVDAHLARALERQVRDVLGERLAAAAGRGPGEAPPAGPRPAAADGS
jgi:DNA-binding transcriptional MerR regulator